jgi:uncharacterized protein YgiM (DUF1202 family)
MADVIAGGNQNFDLGFMKMNYCLMLGLLVATSAVAQDSTKSLPPIPAPAAAPATGVAEAAPAETNAPAKKATTHHHKRSAKKTAASTEKAEKSEFSESSVALVPGPAEVFVNNLNVRGQAGLQGEVVAHLQKGDTVTVLGQINLDKHKANEPSQWAKIALPSSTEVWVRSSFINSKDNTVLPKRLNLRAGPSEDYSVLGVVERGTTVNVVGQKGDWSKIDAPTNSFAFIAAMYLKQESSGITPINPTPSTETGLAPETNTIPTTLMTVTEPQPIETQPPQPVQPQTTEPQTLPQPPGTGSTLLPPPIGTDTNTPSVAEGTPGTTEEASLPPRIVTHEGYVRSSISLVAPTYYELYDATTQNAIDYLHSTTTNLNLSRYDGFEIIVTGEEGMDARWKDTPVLNVQRIYVVSTNLPPTVVLKSPRARSMH